MTDEPFVAPGCRVPTLRAPRRTEHLWAIRKDGHQFDCELLDHETHSVEVRCLRDLEWFYGHRCETRELALAEADERKAVYLRDGRVLIG